MHSVGHPRVEWICVPSLSPGVDRREFGDVVLLREPRLGTVLALEAEDRAVLSALDAGATPDALAERFGPSALALLDELDAGGFLDGSAVPVIPKVAMSGAGLEVAGFDRWTAMAWHAGGRWAATRAGFVVAVVLGVVGALVLLSGGADSSAADGTDTVLALWCLVMAGPALGVMHETAHALVQHRYGQAPRRAGFGFYYGGVCFFVDATEALLLPKRARVAQALAGPAANAAVAGILVVVAAVVAGEQSTVLRAVAVLVYLDLIFNLVPLLEFDGYWVLSDLIDEPALRRRSLTALGRMLRKPTPAGLDRRDRMLAAYGATSLAAGVFLMAGAAWLWLHELGPLVREGAAASWSGQLAAALLVIPLVVGLVVPLVFHLVSTISRPARGGERK
jgi:putative peptide zinc metalloprotease protein